MKSHYHFLFNSLYRISYIISSLVHLKLYLESIFFRYDASSLNTKFFQLNLTFKLRNYIFCYLYDNVRAFAISIKYAVICRHCYVGNKCCEIISTME